MTAKRTGGFRHPMNQVECIVGWMYVFVHVFAMPFILSALNAHVFPALGFQLGSTWLNLLYYAVGFFFLLGFLFHFLKESFADMCGSFMDTVVAVLVGFVAYIFLSGLVNFLLSFFLSDLTNPNTAAVNQITKLNPNRMVVIGVLLAPVVEETLFRGVVFGTLHRKNVLLAYLVSTLFFSFYHLWQDIVLNFSPSMLLYLLQYAPAGIVLGWVYSHSRTVWAPVFLHMIINYVSISVTIG